ncbi:MULTISPECIES: GNAT family N-acetyltransferase [Burkholderia]|uniref:GNAT family acetyltransferase n=1 Tax=Burkholderia aenigmatica TaxID=2015348 RepID=A0A6J5IX02_9BURK|nr:MULTISPECIES: GNAT family N-acetyltransferase [Burkholderia]UKD15005.1 GNAT family N-acetyltransferase [Burkholderia aenigmatica]CAB3964201.1 GNAT family acetyltransferase [Burkholderia aenigmatica]
MHVVVFRDRCERVIRIVFDDAGATAVAYRDDDAIGALDIDDDGDGEGRSPSLTRLYVEPAYRRSGIAHTLLACASREFGRPIRIDAGAREWPDTPAWSTLCRCLEYEGVVVVRQAARR